MISIIDAAGWPIWLLIFASFVATTLIIERLISLRRNFVMPKHLLEQTLNEYQTRGVSADMIQNLRRNSPLGRVLAAGLRHEKYSRDIMRDAIEESGRAVGHELERFLPTLGTIAAMAPLMGLLGTVIGMIEIFAAQSPNGGSPEQLAYGISVALYNTAFGLIIAIPSMIFYRHFRALVDGYLIDMEQQAIRLVEAIHGERDVQSA